MTLCAGQTWWVSENRLTLLSITWIFWTCLDFYYYYTRLTAFERFCACVFWCLDYDVYLLWFAACWFFSCIYASAHLTDAAISIMFSGCLSIYAYLFSSEIFVRTLLQRKTITSVPDNVDKMHRNWMFSVLGPQQFGATVQHCRQCAHSLHSPADLSTFSLTVFLLISDTIGMDASEWVFLLIPSYPG